MIHPSVNKLRLALIIIWSMCLGTDLKQDRALWSIIDAAFITVCSIKIVEEKNDGKKLS